MGDNIAMMLGFAAMGLLFLVLSFLIYAVQHHRQKGMTATVMGQVAQYSYLGNDNIAPVISYVVGGKTYHVRRKFRSIVTKSVRTPVPTVCDCGAYVNEKDTLVLQTGCITNYEAMMEALWPIGQPIPVFYNPKKPKQACAEKMRHLPCVVSVIYMWMGVGLILVGLVLGILLPSTFF